MSAPSRYPCTQSPPPSFLPAPLTYLQGAPVSFGAAIRQAFRNGFAYRGRASRSAYWWFALFQVIVFALVEVVSIPLVKVAPPGSLANAAIAIILGIPVLYLELAALALTVRRLHDTDRSGWWMLIALVPYVGSIVLLIFTVLKGTPGPNRYQL